MGKKLNRSEIDTIARKILKEVNEVNSVYNDGIKASQAYLDAIDKIQSKDPLYKAKKELEKQVTIQLGSNWQNDVVFSLYPEKQSMDNKYYKIKKEVDKEIIEFNKTQFKKIHSIPTDSWGRESNEIYKQIVDDITIGQIDITDIQLLVNTIKAKLL